MSHCQWVSQISHLEAFTSISALGSINTRWALKSFAAHHSPWPRWTLRTLREGPTESDEFTSKLKLKLPRNISNLLVVLCCQMLLLPLIFLSDPGKECFSAAWKKIQANNNNNNKKSTFFPERNNFMSLLDHLWILLALVVLWDLELPNTIKAIYLNYTGLSVIINLNFRQNLILTGIPGAPTSPLFPSVPLCP